jgi:Protein of unknown function (DUF3105)
MSRGGARRNPQVKLIEAEERREVERRNAQRRRWLITIGVLAAALGFIVFLATRPPPAALAAVETFADQGASHIDASSPLPNYNSNPPTSGPHASNSYQCGIYREAVPDLNQVHNLEHGVVMIQYDPSISAEERDVIEGYARDAGTHTIVAPREGMDSPIVLTAWTRRLALASADRAAISVFYDTYAQFGPERGVACPFQIDQSETG